MSEENVESKTELLSYLSHEMRSALNIIMASCTLAANRIDDKSRVQEHLKRICSTVDHLTRLLDDYLTICRIRDGESFLAEEEFAISDLGEELRLLMEPLAFEKDICFMVTAEQFVNIDVVGDHGRLLQILINLTANSIKYTPEGGTVLVNFEEINNNESEDESLVPCRITCADNGIGISEDFLKKIFQPFVRSDDIRVTKTHGTGLGMSIVKDAVDSMGGSIHIDSMINVGTTVTVMLKLKKNIRKG